MDREQLTDLLIKSIVNAKPRKAPENLDNGLKGAIIILKILNDNECLSAGELSKILDVSTARVAVAINNLVVKGYVKKSKDKIDARKTLVTITDLGKKELARRENLIREHLIEKLKNLTEQDLLSLINIINKIE